VAIGEASTLEAAFLLGCCERRFRIDWSSKSGRTGEVLAMTRIGSYQAKTHLPELLERVSRGEIFTITKHGRPVAQLVPPETEETLDAREAIRRMRELRKGISLGPGCTIREMIEEGRRS
jgi:prevent-host-death family protein